MDRARPLNGTSCGKRSSFPYALNIIIDLLFNFLILSNVSEILWGLSHAILQEKVFSVQKDRKGKKERETSG